MKIAILGPVLVSGPDGHVPLSGKQRAVLTTLLLHANTIVSRSRLVAALWDSPPRSACANLTTYVHQLRRALSGIGLQVHTEGSSYSCSLSPDHLDVLLFDDAVRQARQSLDRGDLREAERVYAGAIALWRGTPAEGVPLGRAMSPRIAELEERFSAARSGWIDVRLALGRQDMIAELQVLVEAHPLHERSWEQLMIALYHSGRRAEALAAYREVRALTIAELGIEPGRGLQRLHRAMLNDDLDTTCPAAFDAAGFVGPIRRRI